ncbi:MAG: UDP-4-amino-4,6-dideoxy-N-acetyl-beta-L-altrosamine N-acetyltransferase [Deferribacteraceae bacterium]|jgi:UDP-4-amino-4,6-dideoxy-N-acetyl-beta-L-altrosamine N-acetyltransferase|nr:UDP-4-amino-4,6-dideoxy-N-acetyl-beta-L-altrosamine N-acetyltransferase [Deferribacteraceae bacterium]
MSVLFFTEGGGSYGLGHISRTKAIAQALEEEWVKSAFICDIPSGFSLDNSHVIRFAWFNDEERLRAELASLAAPIDAIVVDSYNAGINTLRFLASFRTPILFLDDYYRLDYPKGLILNPVKMRYPEIFGWRVFSGAEYYPLRNPFWDLTRLELSDRKHTLITLGGADSNDLLTPVVKAVREAVNGEVIALTAGGGISPAPGVSYITSRLDMYDIRELIRCARVIVCAGGVTLAEAARCGTPAVVISLAQNQKGNIKMFCMGGSALFAGDAAAPDIALNVAKKLEAFNDADLWERFSKRGASLVDGQGARRIAKLLIIEMDGVFYYDELKRDHELDGVMMTNFINCSSEELSLILETRNSEKVRCTVYNQQRITQAAHLEFIKSLQGSQSSGYWLVSEGDEYLGVFSITDIDRFNSECEVGYYKLPDVKRDGVGKLLLKLAAYTAFTRLNLASMTAESFAGNIASIKSLERSGFSLEENKVKILSGEENRVCRYRLRRSPAALKPN